MLFENSHGFFKIILVMNFNFDHLKSTHPSLVNTFNELFARPYYIGVLGNVHDIFLDVNVPGPLAQFDIIKW